MKLDLQPTPRNTRRYSGGWVLWGSIRFHLLISLLHSHTWLFLLSYMKPWLSFWCSNTESALSYPVGQDFRGKSYFLVKWARVCICCAGSATANAILLELIRCKISRYVYSMPSRKTCYFLHLTPLVLNRPHCLTMGCAAFYYSCMDLSCSGSAT